MATMKCCCCFKGDKGPSTNYVNVTDVEIIQNECLNSLMFSPEDKILHLGCMHGQISVDYLTSKIVCEWFVAADDSEESEVFKRAKPRKSGYGVFDLLDDDQVEKYKKCWNGFTKLLCFSLSSWIRDPVKALRNANRLLQDYGHCVFTFVARSPVHEAYKKLSENPAWISKMKDYEELIPLAKGAHEPDITFASYLVGAGFEVVKCESLGVTQADLGQETVFEHIKHASPIVSRIEKHRQKDFLRDCAEAFPEEQKKIFTYDLVVAIAQKKSLFIPQEELLKELIGYGADK